LNFVFVWFYCVEESQAVKNIFVYFLCLLAGDYFLQKGRRKMGLISFFIVMGIIMPVTAFGETSCFSCKVGSGSCTRCFSDPVLRQEAWSIESKAEVISSKIDIIAESGCGAIPITAPVVITQSGSYCLQNIITAVDAATPVIDIQVNDVAIDFNGNIAHGFVNIKDDASHIVMHDGVIDAADTAGTFTADYCISALECKNLTLQSMKLRNAAETALNVATEVEELTIQDCIFTRYDSYGIYLEYGEAVRISNSLFWGHEHDQTITVTGFAICDGAGLDIRGSTFQFNGVGIYLNDFHSAHIEGDFLTNNVFGLNLVNAQAIDIENVEVEKAKHGDSPDTEVRTGIGFLVSGGHSISFDSCFVSGYNYGYDMTSTVTQFTFFNCTARENVYGFVFAPGVTGFVQACTAIENKQSTLGAGFWDQTNGNQFGNFTVRYAANVAQGNGSNPTSNTSTNYERGPGATATSVNAQPWIWKQMSSSPTYWNNVNADL
jgi:hypothetical protein